MHMHFKYSSKNRLNLISVLFYFAGPDQNLKFSKQTKGKRSNCVEKKMFVSDLQDTAFNTLERVDS